MPLKSPLRPMINETTNKITNTSNRIFVIQAASLAMPSNLKTLAMIGRHCPKNPCNSKGATRLWLPFSLWISTSSRRSRESPDGTTVRQARRQPQGQNLAVSHEEKRDSHSM